VQIAPTDRTIVNTRRSGVVGNTLSSAEPDVSRTRIADARPAADPGVGGVQSLTVREPKVGEEEVVESPPKVSGFALVRELRRE
jgi:hypothetical protein